jgi:hypothetical protein
MSKREDHMTDREALKLARDCIAMMIRGYVNLLENGRDRILMLGGQCDDVTTMETSDPRLREAKAALAAADAALARSEQKGLPAAIALQPPLPEPEKALFLEWFRGIEDGSTNFGEHDYAMAAFGAGAKAARALAAADAALAEPVDVARADVIARCERESGTCVEVHSRPRLDACTPENCASMLAAAPPTAPVVAPNEHPGATDDALRDLWRSNGGRFNGPHVETGSMPESRLLPFLRGLVLETAAQTAPVVASDALPPLPEPAVESFATDAAMRTFRLSTFSADQMHAYARAAIAPPAAEPTNTLEWLASHCRMLGMTKKSHSGLLAHDIALFTVDLKKAAEQAPAAVPVAPVGWSISLDEAASELLKNTIGSDDCVSPITLSMGEVTGDDGAVEYGLRVHLTEYPEEGVILLATSPTPPTA